MSNLVDQGELNRILRRHPSVHRLVFGVYLQEYVWFAENVLAVPLTPLGFIDGASFVAGYHQEVFGYPPHPSMISMLQERVQSMHPVVALVHFGGEADDHASLEALAAPELDLAEEVIGWLTGNNPEPFASVIAHRGVVGVREIQPRNARRTHLGFFWAQGETSRAIYGLARQDERLAFALTLHRDALAERNPAFKIARLFNVLEALAFALKGSEVRSRAAVKKMMFANGLDEFANVNLESTIFRYSPIEFAGRLRDKLFHGVPFERGHVNSEAQAAYDILESRPEILISDMVSYCELAFSMWAHDQSPARTAADARQMKPVAPIATADEPEGAAQNKDEIVIDPQRLLRYHLSLAEDGTSIIMRLVTERGKEVDLSLPIGHVVSEFIGKLIEQCQFAGDQMAKAGRLVDSSQGVYPVYPLKTAVAWSQEQREGQRHPFLFYNFGGCALALGVDAKSATAQFQRVVDGPSAMLK